MRFKLFLLLWGQSFFLIAQQDTLKTFNLQSFTPSALLKYHQIEVKFFNNLYTQTKGFDMEYQKQDQGIRSTYLASFVQVLYGTSSRFNVGMDLYFRSVKIDKADHSPFQIFRFERNNTQRSAISKIGPKIKVLPFKKFKRLSLQSTLLLPVTNNLEGVKDNTKPWLDWDTYTWLNQLFWDKTLNDKWQVFTALELYWRLPRNSYNETSLFTTPIKGFMSFFPNNKTTLYGMIEWGPTWGESPVLSNFYSQIGLGGKYQITPHLEIETLGSLFPFGKNQGAGYTYNLGFRYLY